MKYIYNLFIWIFVICVKETDPDFDLCAICVEGYKAGDVLRVLPCKYVTCCANTNCWCWIVDVM